MREGLPSLFFHNNLFVFTKFATYTELQCVRTTTAFALRRTCEERASSHLSKFIVVRTSTSHELRTTAYVFHRLVHVSLLVCLIHVSSPLSFILVCVCAAS